MNQIELNKKLMRSLVLDKRRVFDNKLYQEANEIICLNVLQLISTLVNSKKIIGLYWPLKGEPDLREVINSTTRFIALPKIINKEEIIFTQYTAGDKLEKASFWETYQPVSHREVLPDLIVTPALAFSLKGYRLGFGVGHFDRYINKRRKECLPVTVGVCFHDFLFEYIDFEEHDCKFDYVITENIIIKTL